MAKEHKIALAFALGVLTVAAIVEAMVVPSSEVWDKVQHFRQVAGLAVAGVVLAFLVASVERRPRDTGEPSPADGAEQPTASATGGP